MKNTDEVKGRITEAVGDITDNNDLQRNGQSDRGAGRAKEVLGDVKEKAENAVNALKDRVHELSSRAR